MPNALSTSRSLIITGMHRSGTSLTASLLQSSGIDIGQNLLEGNFSNPKGHFEDKDFMKFHEQVLQSYGLGTEGWVLQEKIQVPELFLEDAKTLIRPRQVKPLWGWKDPRTSLFLDFWVQLLPDAQFLFIYRNPWEVIDSLYRRGDSSFSKNPSLALQVWLNYNQAIINFYDRHREQCILLCVNSVCKSPNYLIEIINERLNISLTTVKNLYDNSIFHRNVSNSYRTKIIKNYFPEALHIYKELNERAKQFDDDPEVYQMLDYDSPDPNETWILKDWQITGELKKDLKFATGQLQQTQTQLEQFHTQHIQTQENLASLDTRLQQSQTELEQVQAQLRQSHTELAQARIQVQQSQGELEQVQAQLHQSHTELAQVRIQLQQSQGELEQAQAQLQQSQGELGLAQTQLQKSQGELGLAQTQLQKSHTELEQAQTQLQKSHTELEQDQEKLQQSQGELEQSQVQLSQLQKLVHQSQSEMEIAQKEWSKSQIKLQESHQYWEKSQSQLQKLMQALAINQEQVLLLQSELERKGQQKEHLNEVIRAMKTSKFWKLRQGWFRIKSSLGLKLEPDITNF